MSNALAAMAVAAFMFIQFRNPATDALLFETDPLGEFVLDGEGNKKPVGVKAYGPGSKQYRAAEAALATQNIRAGKKGLTGDKLFENATELMARTVFEYVGFDYNGKTINGADRETALGLNRALFNDPEYAAVREQIAEKQGDLGGFLKTPTTA